MEACIYSPSPEDVQRLVLEGRLDSADLDLKVPFCWMFIESPLLANGPPTCEYPGHESDCPVKAL